mmetsp:Transcript_80857/g.168760  ORF Transcript_80857/g.168760 Transcript_80857/m.168760 type:complete len:289 (-) Transcript_80857:637-1503(-)
MQASFIPVAAADSQALLLSVLQQPRWGRWWRRRRRPVTLATPLGAAAECIAADVVWGTGLGSRCPELGTVTLRDEVLFCASCAACGCLLFLLSVAWSAVVTTMVVVGGSGIRSSVAPRGYCVIPATLVALLTTLAPCIPTLLVVAMITMPVAAAVAVAGMDLLVVARRSCLAAIGFTFALHETCCFAFPFSFAFAFAASASAFSRIVRVVVVAAAAATGSSLGVIVVVVVMVVVAVAIVAAVIIATVVPVIGIPISFATALAVAGRILRMPFLAFQAPIFLFAVVCSL